MTSSEHAQLLHCAQTNSALRTLMAEHEAMAAELVKLRAEVEQMRPIYVAAIDWHEAPHTYDSNCAAGECDDCPARIAMEKLNQACKEAK